MYSDRRKLYQQLSREYPDFTYKNFSFAVINSELRIEFDFNLGSKYSFKPYHIFPLPEDFDEKIVPALLYFGRLTRHQGRGPTRYS